MDKILFCLLFVLSFTTSISYADIHRISDDSLDINGSLTIRYKINNNGKLPEIFYMADKIFVEIDCRGNDIIYFEIRGKIVREVKIDEKSGETNFIPPFKLSNIKADLNHIQFNFINVKGEYIFFSTSLEWKHRDGILATLFNATFGIHQTYELKMIEEK